MPKIENIKSLERKLKQLAMRYVDSPNARKGESVIVGYTAAYATAVHENTKAFHARGQAKYLEQPARELSNTGELSKIITNAVKKGIKLGKALLLAGLRIQRESQKLVPIDTGNLRASAFTRQE